VLVLSLSYLFQSGCLASLQGFLFLFELAHDVLFELLLQLLVLLEDVQSLLLTQLFGFSVLFLFGLSDPLQLLLALLNLLHFAEVFPLFLGLEHRIILLS
jgi:hypothetical protein